MDLAKAYNDHQSKDGKKTYSITHMRKLFFSDKLIGVQKLGQSKQNKEVKVKGVIFGSAQQVVNADFAKNVDQVDQNIHNPDPLYGDWNYVNFDQQRSRKFYALGTIYQSVQECLQALNMKPSNLYYKLNNPNP